MIRVLSVMPSYDPAGKLLSSNISVEIVLASGEVGSANFTLGADEIDFNAIGENIRHKMLQGLEGQPAE